MFLSPHFSNWNFMVLRTKNIWCLQVGVVLLQYLLHISCWEALITNTPEEREEETNVRRNFRVYQPLKETVDINGLNNFEDEKIKWNLEFILLRITGCFNMQMVAGVVYIKKIVLLTKAVKGRTLGN